MKRVLSIQFRKLTIGLPREFPLACAVGHADIFAVNNTHLWRVTGRSARKLFPRTHPINAVYKGGQTATAVFQVFGMILPGIELNLPETLPMREGWSRMNKKYLRLPNFIAVFEFGFGSVRDFPITYNVSILTEEQTNVLC